MVSGKGLAECCNGLGVDPLDHPAAGGGDKASRRCLGQFGEIVSSGLRTALVDHVVPVGLSLGRWGQSPCSAESHCGDSQNLQGDGSHRCIGPTADQELKA